MSPQLESFLRGLGVTILMAISLFVSNSTNTAPIIGVPASMFIASLAAYFDKKFSPDGTVVFGSIGKAV